MGRRTVEENGNVVLTMGFDEVLDSVNPIIPGFELNPSKTLLVPKSFRINLIAHNENPDRNSDSSDVNDVMLRTITEELSTAAETGSRRVLITMSTYGGDAYFATGCVDAINYYKLETGGRVRIVGMGIVASAGTFIMQAASPGERVMLENSTFMMHPMISGDSPAENQRRRARVDESDRLRMVLWKQMSRRTGLTIRKIKSLEKANDLEGSYLSAEQAKKLGLIDQVIKLR